jgi:hypothetical protein
MYVYSNSFSLSFLLPPINAKYIRLIEYFFGINIGGWAREYNIQSTNFCRITTCNERCINRVHLTFSLYTNCQNRPGNDRLNEFVMLIYIYNNVMRSCNERTTLHCVEPYLYYIILVNKQIFSEE